MDTETVARAVGNPDTVNSTVVTYCTVLLFLIRHPWNRLGATVALESKWEGDWEEEAEEVDHPKNREGSHDSL